MYNLIGGFNKVGETGIKPLSIASASTVSDVSVVVDSPNQISVPSIPSEQVVNPVNILNEPNQIMIPDSIGSLSLVSSVTITMGGYDSLFPDSIGTQEVVNAVTITVDTDPIVIKNGYLTAQDKYYKSKLYLGDQIVGNTDTGLMFDVLLEGVVSTGIIYAQ